MLSPTTLPTSYKDRAMPHIAGHTLKVWKDSDDLAVGGHEGNGYPTTDQPLVSLLADDTVSRGYANEDLFWSLAGAIDEGLDDLADCVYVVTWEGAPPEFVMTYEDYLHRFLPSKWEGLLQYESFGAEPQLELLDDYPE